MPPFRRQVGHGSPPDRLPGLLPGQVLGHCDGAITGSLSLERQMLAPIGERLNRYAAVAPCQDTATLTLLSALTGDVTDGGMPAVARRHPSDFRPRVVGTPWRSRVGSSKCLVTGAISLCSSWWVLRWTGVMRPHPPVHRLPAHRRSLHLQRLGEPAVLPHNTWSERNCGAGGNRTAACAMSSLLASGHLACSVPVFE